MSRLGALIAVDLKNQFPLLLLWRQVKFGLQRRRVLAITVLVAVCLLPLLYSFIRVIGWLYTGLHAIEQESAMVGLAVIAGQLVLFVFGFFYVVSAFYFSKDLALLIPLPLRPHQVVFSKLAVVVINECLTMLPLILPLLIGYGILARAPLDYWIMLGPVYLLLPVIPLTLAALLAIGLMRVVNLSRRKDAFIVVGSLALITLQLILQMRLRGEEGDAQAVIRLLTAEDGLVRMIGRNFPPSVWATRSLAQGFSSSGLLDFLRLAGVSALAFAGTLVLAERLFYQGAIGLAEVSAQGRAMSRADLERGISSGRHWVRPIFLREMRLMNRTPIFLLNGVLVVVLIPVVFLIGVKSTGGSNSFLTLFASLGSAHAATMVLGLTGFFLICGCLNGTASSAFSREGRHFWISKIIPVPWSQQIAAKLIHASLISLLGILVAAAVAAFALRVPAPQLLAAILLATAGAILLNLVGLRIDLMHPRLKWTNPQVAIKQNLNVILAMVVQLGLMAACGLLARLLLVVAGLSGTLVYLLLLAVALGGSWIAWREIKRFAEWRYLEVEG
jgi:ABC-2 type transport system permease protein